MSFSYLKLGFFGIISFLSVTVSDAYSQEEITSNVVIDTNEVIVHPNEIVIQTKGEIESTNEQKPWFPEDDILSVVAIFTAIGTAIGLVISHAISFYQLKQQNDAKFLELTHQYTDNLVEKFDKGFSIEDSKKDDDDKGDGTENDAKILKKKLDEAKKNYHQTIDLTPQEHDTAKKELYAANRAVEKQKEECINWAFKYVDSLDMLTYIKKEKAIPPKLTAYFGPGWFGMAKSLMVWHDHVVTKDDGTFGSFRSAIETWPHVYGHCFQRNNGIDPVPVSEFPQVLIEHFEIDDSTVRTVSDQKTDTILEDMRENYSIKHRTKPSYRRY